MDLRIFPKCFAAGLVILGATVVFSFSESSEARTNNNWSSVSRSNQCSIQAERYADRRARRQTATAAAGGAAIGAIAGGRRDAGRGALIGGGAGLFHANSRWRTYYNRSYRNCINS